MILDELLLDELQLDEFSANSTFMMTPHTALRNMNYIDNI